MPIEIIPSILSADLSRLAHDVQAVMDAGADKVQVDVMDGRFVPNISMGLPVVRSLSQGTDAVLDVHLMIEEPERYVEAFVDAGASVVTVHVEATCHLQGTLARIKDRGALCGAALNPATPLVAVEEVLSEVDLVLLMTVNPGFGGQGLVETAVPKVARLRDILAERGLAVPIQVDGGVNVDTVGRLAAAGATQLVAGSAVFGAGVPVAEAIGRLRRAAEAGAAVAGAAV
ncbi:MAG: ribulose-phosphate 3-epimerase [Anaerolineae bacterium]